jgi:hypothetical protein
VVHDRRVGERELILGVSGKLIDGNLVMYDRETDSLWHQESGSAVEGELSEEQLQELPEEQWQITTWKEWKQMHPDTLVLSCAHCEGRGPATGTIDQLDSEPANEG